MTFGGVCGCILATAFAFTQPSLYSATSTLTAHENRSVPGYLALAAQPSVRESATSSVGKDGIQLFDHVRVQRVIDTPRMLVVAETPDPAVSRRVSAAYAESVAHAINERENSNHGTIGVEYVSLSHVATTAALSRGADARIVTVASGVVSGSMLAALFRETRKIRPRRR